MRYTAGKGAGSRGSGSPPSAGVVQAHSGSHFLTSRVLAPDLQLAGSRFLLPTMSALQYESPDIEKASTGDDEKASPALEQPDADPVATMVSKSRKERLLGSKEYKVVRGMKSRHLTFIAIGPSSVVCLDRAACSSPVLTAGGTIGCV